MKSKAISKKHIVDVFQFRHATKEFDTTTSHSGFEKLRKDIIQEIEIKPNLAAKLKLSITRTF